MDTIRALVADPDAPGHLAERDVPAPVAADHEVLVAVRAVSLNRGEVRTLQDAEAGWCPGWDVAGEVIQAAADRSGPPVGTRVVGLVGQGAWAQQVAVATDRLAPIPDGVSWAAAATLPVAGLTALRSVEMAELDQDHAALITGASGGVGRFAVQLAAQLGADVTAAVSAEDRGRPLLELGAARYTMALPADGRFHLVLESVGGETLGYALEHVAPGGLVVSCGNSSQQPTTFDSSRFYRQSGARLRAFVLGAELARSRSGTLDLGRLANMVAAGHLDVGIERQASWRDAPEVVEAFWRREIPGKVVLEID